MSSIMSDKKNSIRVDINTLTPCLPFWQKMDCIRMSTGPGIRFVKVNFVVAIFVQELLDLKSQTGNVECLNMAHPCRPKA